MKHVIALAIALLATINMYAQEGFLSQGQLAFEEITTDILATENITLREAIDSANFNGYWRSRDGRMLSQKSVEKQGIEVKITIDDLNKIEMFFSEESMSGSILFTALNTVVRIDSNELLLQSNGNTLRDEVALKFLQELQPYFVTYSLGKLFSNRIAFLTAGSENGAPMLEISKSDSRRKAFEEKFERRTGGILTVGTTRNYLMMYRIGGSITIELQEDFRTPNGFTIKIGNETGQITKEGLVTVTTFSGASASIIQGKEAMTRIIQLMNEIIEEAYSIEKEILFHSLDLEDMEESAAGEYSFEKDGIKIFLRTNDSQLEEFSLTDESQENTVVYSYEGGSCWKQINIEGEEIFSNYCRNDDGSRRQGKMYGIPEIKLLDVLKNLNK